MHATDMHLLHVFLYINSHRETRVAMLILMNPMVHHVPNMTIAA